MEELNHSNVVVAGRIDSVYRLREDRREHDYSAIRSVTLVVGKVYKGDVKVGDKLVLAQGNGVNCSFTWDDESIGEEFLFYLGDPGPWGFSDEETDDVVPDIEPSYETSYCGRSTSLDSAKDDLAYLENLDKLKGKTRVSGTLYFSARDERSVEGIEVRINGKDKQYKTKYLKAGFFEIYDIPPGEYVAEIMAPAGWQIGEHWRTSSIYSRPDNREGLGKNQRRIKIGKAEHVGLDLSLVPDTLVSGRVISPLGKHMANVCVRAMSPNDADDRGGWESCTDRKGEFTFHAMAPGVYQLVVNQKGKIDDKQPFGRIYYPGVFERSKAGVIFVEPGKYNLDLDIQIPQAIRLIVISGMIIFADGSPVERARIRFTPVNQEKFNPIGTQADEQGRFILRIPYEAAGTISGEKYFWKSEYAECPQIVAAQEEAGSNQVATAPLSIAGIEPLSNIVLKFPFELCVKIK